MTTDNRIFYAIGFLRIIKRFWHHTSAAVCSMRIADDAATAGAAAAE